MRLLHDVTEPKQFSTVLAYDVSMWGRFQDTDAAAYHEYHCRLHGADVVYVAELFGAEVNPITAMLKSRKRAMAAEYSGDLVRAAKGSDHRSIEWVLASQDDVELVKRICDLYARTHLSFADISRLGSVEGRTVTPSHVMSSPASTQEFPWI